MNELSPLHRAAIFVAVFFIAGSQASAQPAADFGPSYDVVLQVVVGSDDVRTSGLPKDLDAIARQLKTRFAFQSYSLANTFLGRVGEKGNLEYKSVATFLGRERNLDAPMFLDWSLVNFNGSTGTADNSYHAQNFRFGARVPVRMGLGPEAVTNYQSIGLSFHRVGFYPNVPNLLGTLSLPNTAGTMFLIVTIKPATL